MKEGKEHQERERVSKGNRVDFLEQMLLGSRKEPQKK